MKIKIDEIRIDGGTQTRELINETAVVEYTEALLEGSVFPPVDVFDDGVSKWLVDGFHRLFSHKRAGYKDIEATLHKGTLRDARIFALGVNDKHGLQRTNADKRKTVQIALDDFELQDLSDGQIAKICKVSATFVAKCRKAAGIERPAEKTYTTRHGTTATMDTEKIGKKATPKPTKEPEPVTQLAPLEQYLPEDDQLTELSHVNAELHAENLKLHDKMTVLSGDQEKINGQFEEFRAQITALEAELKAVKNSRDQFQAKNADLIKQVNYWRKRAEKAEKTK